MLVSSHAVVADVIDFGRLYLKNGYICEKTLFTLKK